MNDYVPWLRHLAEKGGKGVVNNIDARCLGRIADELEYLNALLSNAIQEYPVASGVYVDSDGQAGYGSLKAMRLHLGVTSSRGYLHVVSSPPNPGAKHD
jgi:hypothetical protein